MCTCKLDVLDDQREQVPLVKMKTSKHSQSKRPQHTCKPKAEGGCGGRTILLEELEDHVVDLLMAILEGIEGGGLDEEQENERLALEIKIMTYEQHKEALIEDYAEGEYSPKEYRQAVAVLDRKMDETLSMLAGMGVQKRLNQSAAELRRKWDDPAFPLARKRATVMAYIKQIRIHPAVLPYNVRSPNYIKIIQ